MCFIAVNQGRENGQKVAGGDDQDIAGSPGAASLLAPSLPVEPPQTLPALVASVRTSGTGTSSSTAP